MFHYYLYYYYFIVIKLNYTFFIAIDFTVLNIIITGVMLSFDISRGHSSPSATGSARSLLSERAVLQSHIQVFISLIIMIIIIDFFMHKQ